ncbi:MAG: chemotaxis protein CheW [Alphaproteobacteria bacterium]|nr:chemotaxis protein CheW [Alphaproteobacteria bacterium]
MNNTEASTNTIKNSSQSASAEEQVFVTVYVDNQLFGIPVEQVQDILVPEKIAEIPLAQDEIAGSINLRGRIVTVINVRKRLGLPPINNQSRLCATVEHGNELYSLMVDSVGTVLNLSNEKIEPNLSTLDTKWKDISSGVVRLDGELMIVLDIDAFFNFETEQQ